MIKTIILLGTGGAVGTIGRYLVHVWLSESNQSGFPLSTFVVNVTGCILIGLLYGWSEHAFGLSPEARLFLVTGLCGGFTTFSTFAYENLRLLNGGSIGMTILYTSASVVLGIVAVFAGHYLVKQLY